MKNILLITSKKNLNTLNYKNILSYLKKIKLPHEVIDTELEDFSNLKTNKQTLIVSLGGDGTALKAMKVGWLNNLDVLPIGSGRVGYLVSSIKNFNSVIDEWKINKSKKVSRKAIIQNKNYKLPAFNEVVIIKNSPTRLLDLVIETYDQEVKLRADGIIISTSLGSTAYNYSAGGPIVHNDIESIVVTPISPFSKFPRSIVLNDKSKIKVTIPKDQNYAIQFDGIVEVQEKSKTKISYEYELSSKSIKLIDHDNKPKIDNFLDQILR